MAGGTYHVMSNGARDEMIFRCDSDRAMFLLILARVVARLGWVCMSYTLLGTHFHLLVRTPNPDLDIGMQRLKSAYALAFNRRYGGRGALFRERYAAVVIETEAQLVRAHGYLALNARRAGLVPKPELWPWSSYRALIGLEHPPPFLDVRAALEPFGSTPEVAREQLRLLVEETMRARSHRDVGRRDAARPRKIGPAESGS